MSTLTLTSVALLPRVNLLPPEIEEQRRFRRVQGGLGLGVVAALGVVGLLAVLANGQVASAQDGLDQSTARGDALQARTAKYADVPLVYAQVEAGEAQLAQAMGQEVRWSYFLNDLSLKTPDKVWLTSMTVTQQVDSATGAAAPSVDDAYIAPGVGTVTFEGNGYAHNDVAAWLQALAKQEGLTQPYFTSSEDAEIGSEDAVTFTSQATLTEDALSGRYGQKAGN